MYYINLFIIILIFLDTICKIFYNINVRSYTRHNTLIIHKNTYSRMEASMKRILTLLIIFTILFSNHTVKAQNIDNQPDVASDGAIIMDADTGVILYEKNIHETYYPASITKILTTLVAIENSSLNEIVTFSKEAVFDVDLNSSRIGIDVGEQLTMEQCLYGIMLSSANEVSYAVAEHISGDIESFSKLMNEKAKELGARNSNFVNPHGLPDPNHYTSAYDMAMIAKGAIQNETFRNITQTRTYSIPPTNIQEETRYLANHHKFIKQDIQYDGAIGGKTGYTSLAKFTLVTYAKRNGMTLISVVMHSPTAEAEYGDTANLLNYGFDNFTINNIEDLEAPPIEDSNNFFTKYHSFFNTSNSPLEVSQNGKVILPNNISINDAEREIEFVPLEQLVDGKNVIGSITYSYNNNYIGETEIVFNNIDAPTLSKSLYISAPKVISDNPEQVDDEKAESNNLLPIIIGVVVGIIVLALGLLIIFLRNSKNRRNRRYRGRRFRRR